MKSLPRIDEIESILCKNAEEGKLTKNLCQELVKELKELDILKPIIRSRTEKLIMQTLDNYGEELGPDAKDNEKKEEPIEEKIAHEWFEGQVDRYYLEKRDAYERVSFTMFRTITKGIANEAYQRLVEKEESWREINDRWGTEQDKNIEGRYMLVRPCNINPIIYKALKRLKEGEISLPFRTGKLVTIVGLIKWTNIELNQGLRPQIEKEIYNKWLDDKTNEIIEKWTSDAKTLH